MSFDLSPADIDVLRRHHAPGVSADTLRAHLRRRTADRGDAALALGAGAVGTLDTAFLRLARQGLATAELAARWADVVEEALARLPSNTLVERPKLSLPQVGRPRDLGGPILCGVHVDADDGVERVRMRCWRLNGLLASYASLEVKHYRKGSDGYDKKKAEHLEVSGSVFLTPDGGTTQELALSRGEDDVKETHARFTFVGLAMIAFVEGCGGVSPSSTLWACACSGRFPGTPPDGGGGGGGPGGDGTIDTGP